MTLSSNVLEQIASLPTDAADLDNNHVGGILVRYDLARQFICGLLAGELESAEESLPVDALRLLVEVDVPAMLRTIAAGH